MTAKEYLRQVRHLDSNIASDMDEIAKLESLATKATTVLCDMPSGSRDIHKQESLIVRIMDMKAALEEEINEFLTVKERVKRSINEVPDVDERTVLLLRYISFMRWEQIAVEMDYSVRHVQRLHGRALSVISKNMKHGT